MRVLVTGAAGNLGRVLLPALADAGHEPVALDTRPVEGPFEAVAADIRDADAVRRAAAGADAVVHGAALHGVHLGKWPEADFWSINVTGSFNVYAAARDAGAKRFVLASTMGVYGESSRWSDERWAVVTEDSPARPLDVYGLSKLLAEELGRHHARVDGIGTVALRFGMYVPERTFERYGFRLLIGGVDDRDVAQSVLLALERAGDGGFAAFDIMADTPFGERDAEALARDPLAAIERHWSGTADLVRERGLDLDALLFAHFLWPVDRAKRELGYRPEHGFGEFLRAYAEGRSDYYPWAGLPQWGV
jgi:UDP-glucose 4-epimerase